MMGLKIKERVASMEVFREDVKKALEKVAQTCAVDFVRAKDAADKVEGLIATVASLEQQQKTKEAEAEALRGRISDVLLNGENTDDLIHKRASFIAGAQVIKDLIVDANRVKIPAAEQAAKALEKVSSNHMMIELNKMRDEIQRKYIEPLGRELADMAEIYIQCLQEFYGKHPGVILSKEPALNIPKY